MTLEEARVVAKKIANSTQNQAIIIVIEGGYDAMTAMKYIKDDSIGVNQFFEEVDYDRPEDASK